ncbi:MAG: GNAT family N-acetyltransferase [Candidatus Lokiarchaeota archaeon]|nr:GNAT family N-acetyltransferase [Candidatus Lokiarchaeota archaeon]
MLRGNRVKLGPIKREYIDSFLRWFNDPEITQYLARYRPMTRMAEEEWMENLREREDTIRFSITISNEDGSEILIGNCGIHNINWKNRVGEIGITIGEKAYQNRGYGTEAIELLLEYSFNTVNLNRIELCVYDYNIRAIKSYIKVGFIEEGRKRQFMWNKGKYHDEIMMSILAEEWRNKKNV